MTEEELPANQLNHSHIGRTLIADSRNIYVKAPIDNLYLRGQSVSIYININGSEVEFEVDPGATITLETEPLA